MIANASPPEPEASLREKNARVLEVYGDPFLVRKPK